MDFKELYEKVRGIVLKCRREYYVKLDRQVYEEVSEIGYKLSLKGLYLDELVILRDQLKSYQKQLSPAKQEQYERLLADERFKGRQAMLRELRTYLKDYEM
ncbi:competence protein ComX [Streptococcus intermedius]|uniref:competence protein ComX n=1 Tax=Streptococcus intermedius TaxID=1338 RepID=UPI000F66928A|nr:competence protein ComX [Streptococcus intermedius]RSJ11806.1 hypothetical protein D8832_09785 [Streptococcus intermedius]